MGNLFTRWGGVQQEIFQCTSVALVRENLSICFTRRAICLQAGEGSNNDNDNYNNNLAFPRGGPERGNPAMMTKRLRQGVKETHQHKCCGKNGEVIKTSFKLNWKKHKFHGLVGPPAWILKNNMNFKVSVAFALGFSSHAAATKILGACKTPREWRKAERWGNGNWIPLSIGSVFSGEPKVIER